MCLRISNFLLALFFYLCQSSSTDPAVHGHLIADLFSTNSNITSFNTEIQFWSANLLKNQTIKYNSYFPQVGGAGVLLPGGYFERIYTSLPSHKIIQFFFRFTLIDDWKPDDGFSIEFDGKTVVPKWSLSKFNASGCAKLYGNPQVCDFELLFITGKIFHNSTSLEMRVKSKMVQPPDIASFSFRALQLLLKDTSNLDNFTESICFIADPRYFENDNNSCNCGSGLYKDTSGACLNCHQECRECFGPTSRDCYSCKTSGAGFNGTNCFSCAPPGCNRCIGPNTNQCTQCRPNFWFYSNGTCQADCATPYVKEGLDILAKCKTPCQNNKTFMLWDYSCADFCDPPLQQRLEGEAKFCDFPCSGNQVSYLNGTCGIDINCPPPTVFAVIAEKKVCKHPCSKTNDYFLEKDGTCISTCDYPYKTFDQSLVKVCSFELDMQEVKQVKQLAQAAETAGQVASGGALLSNVFSSGDPGAVFMMSLTKMLQYIKYMNINYPPKLAIMLKQQQANSSTLDFIPPIKKLTREIQSRKRSFILPENFSRYNLNPNFLANFFQSLLLLSMVLMIICLVCLAKVCTKKYKINSIFQTIVPHVKWNLFLAIFSSNYSDIVFYTSLQLKAPDFDSLIGIMSFLVCLIMNGIVVLILARILHVAIEFHKIRTNSPNRILQRRLKSLGVKWERFKIFYEVLKQDSFSKQIFWFIFIVRIVCFNAIIGYLYRYPLTQIIFIILLNVIMLIYLLLKRPFQKLINQIQQLTFEFLIFVFNICVLALAIQDSAEINDLSKKILFGEIIITINIVMSALPSVFLVTKVVLTMSEFCVEKIRSKRRETSNKETKKPIQLGLGQKFTLQPARVSHLQTLQRVRSNEKQLEVIHLNEIPKTQSEIQADSDTFIRPKFFEDENNARLEDLSSRNAHTGQKGGMTRERETISQIHL